MADIDGRETPDGSKGTPAGDAAGPDETVVPEESALRPARSDLHPGDIADDLSANAPRGSAEPPTQERHGGPAAWDGEPGLDNGRPDDGLPRDVVGDGTVAGHSETGDADRMSTAEYGREAEAARDNLSDSAPTPTETPAG
jgi:hypothetical protein